MDQKELLKKIEERRRHERMLCAYSMHYGELNDISTAQVDKSATLLDISGGGLRFSINEPDIDASQLIIRLDIPGWLVMNGDWQPSNRSSDIGILHVVCRVVWIKKKKGSKTEIGVRFTGQIK